MDYTEIENIKAKLKADLPENTYAHIMRTVEKAMEICIGTDADKEVVFVSALLHDCAKRKEPTSKEREALGEFNEYEKVLHAPLGAMRAKSIYGIDDERILSCIKYHTTGRPNMTKEEMIVFLADAIEDGRDYDGVEEIRQKAKISIEDGVLQSLKNVLSFEKGRKIHHLTADTVKFLEEKKNGNK